MLSRKLDLQVLAAKMPMTRECKKMPGAHEFVQPRPTAIHAIFAQPMRA